MKYFSIFSDCILTKGNKRSIISDVSNKQLYFIPNDIYTILLELKKEPLGKIKNDLNKEDQETLMEYIDYFIEEGIGFYCSDPKAFPPINLEYHSPEIINNAIIDIDNNSSYDFKKVIRELIDLRCKFIEVRAYTSISISKIEDFTKEITKGFFRNIDFIMEYPKNIGDLEVIKKLMLDFPVIGKITFHSSPMHLINDFFEFTEKKITNEKCCGIINKKYFTLDLKTFSESQYHNSCLNKKISIDVNGNIKNCPSMSQGFGNTKNTTLKSALIQKDFKKHWNSNKDQINICQDCEFRYICTDCRAYTEDPNDMYAKPLKCGYDPYTNEWEEWSTNPLKKEVNKYYKIDLD